MVSWLEEVCAVWATVSHVWAELSNKSEGVWVCGVCCVFLCSSCCRSTRFLMLTVWIWQKPQSAAGVCVCATQSRVINKRVHYCILNSDAFSLQSVSSHLYYIKKFRMCLSRVENQKGVSDIFGEMEIYIYIHQMKALNELFLLAKVLSSMSVQICIINNWNQYTKSDQTMLKCLFWLSCKVDEMSLTPGSHPSICDPGPQNQSEVSIFRSWDLYIIWKLNK